MLYKVIVRDKLKERFSNLPYPLYKRLKKPIKTRFGGYKYINPNVTIRYFKTRLEAKKTLIANYKQNRGILTPSDLRNIKIVKVNR